VYRNKLTVCASTFAAFVCLIEVVSAQPPATHGETTVPLRYPPGTQTHRQGPYLGENPPGLTPQIFAPGVISTADGFEMDLSFSRNGRECYIGREGQMLVSRWADEGWTSPEIAPFRFGQYGAMVLTSLSGNRMILTGRNGLAVSDKTESGWTEPEVFMPGMGKSITDDGAVYTSWFDDQSGEWRLFRSRYEADGYLPPEEVPIRAYSGDAGQQIMVAATHPQISPDETYVVFESRLPGGYGDYDYYVSFRNSDGTWGEAVNLGGEINSSDQNARARLSPDGEYFFFNRHGDIYWVSAAYLERFRENDR